MSKKKSASFYPLIAAIFVTALVISNIIAVKLVQIFGLILPAAVILFPLVYILGDILTEVYGFARARRVIWIGFLCNLLAVAAIWAAGALPAANFWSAQVYARPAEAQQAYQAILGFAPRLLIASFLAYLVGEFLNAYVLAKLKIRARGRFLWLRTISSTLLGEGADSAVFISVAFFGVIPADGLMTAIVSQWFFKVTYETMATPLTYVFVNWLKKIEKVDYYDRDTNFNPFSIT